MAPPALGLRWSLPPYPCKGCPQPPSMVVIGSLVCRCGGDEGRSRSTPSGHASPERRPCPRWTDVCRGVLGHRGPHTRPSSPRPGVGAVMQRSTTMAASHDASDLPSRLLRALLVSTGVLLSVLVGIARRRSLWTAVWGPSGRCPGRTTASMPPWGRSGAGICFIALASLTCPRGKRHLYRTRTRLPIS